MTPQIDINLYEGVWQRWQTAKDVVNQGLNSVTNSAQQVGQSLKQTATTTTDKAINTVTTTIEQAKGSLEESWQTAEQIKSTTSTAVQSAIASSVNDWLVQHPPLLRLVQMLSWATNHPIISLIILLFSIALIWSIIKAIIRLIETASWSILQIPLKLIQTLITAIALILTKFSSFAVQKITGAKIKDNTSFILPTNSQILESGKQQRLAEISSRLEAIQQEQKQLLQEAANLIASLENSYK